MKKLKKLTVIILLVAAMAFSAFAFAGCTNNNNGSLPCPVCENRINDCKCGPCGEYPCECVFCPECDELEADCKCGPCGEYPCECVFCPECDKLEEDCICTIVTVMLNLQSVSVIEGFSASARVTASPQVDVRWIILDESVATVVVNGRNATITGVASGETVLRVETLDERFYTEIPIEVTAPVLVGGVEIASPRLCLTEGVLIVPHDTTAAINPNNYATAIVSPSNATNQAVTWAISDQDFITLSPSGSTVTFNTHRDSGTETATLTVTTICGNITAEIEVRVVDDYDNCPVDCTCPECVVSFGPPSFIANPFATPQEAYNAIRELGHSMVTIQACDYDIVIDGAFVVSNNLLLPASAPSVPITSSRPCKCDFHSYAAYRQAVDAWEEAYEDIWDEWDKAIYEWTLENPSVIVGVEVIMILYAPASAEATEFYNQIKEDIEYINLMFFEMGIGFSYALEREGNIVSVWYHYRGPASDLFEM